MCSGDGLVAARHLKHFGYSPVVHYPKRSTKGDGLRLFSNLIKQNEDLNIPFLDLFPSMYSSFFCVILGRIFETPMTL